MTQQQQQKQQREQQQQPREQQVKFGTPQCKTRSIIAMATLKIVWDKQAVHTFFPSPLSFHSFSTYLSPSFSLLLSLSLPLARFLIKPPARLTQLRCQRRVVLILILIFIHVPT